MKLWHIQVIKPGLLNFNINITPGLKNIRAQTFSHARTPYHGKLTYQDLETESTQHIELRALLSDDKEAVGTWMSGHCERL